MSEQARHTQEPPHSLEGEMGVIGSVFFDPTTLDEVRAILPTGNAFFRGAHQIIWGTLLRMADAGKAVDYVTLCDELTEASVLNEIGGGEYLVQISESVPHAANAVYYARLVHRDWQKRRAIMIGRELANTAYEPGCEPSECTSKALTELEDLLGSQPSRGMNACEAVTDFESWSAEGGMGFVATGLGPLDIKCGGVPVADMTVVAARPSIGKTTFCLTLCRRIAETGVPVAFISLEMSIRQLEPKLMAQVTGKNEFALRTNKFSEVTLVETISDAKRALAEYGAWLYLEEGTTDITALCSRIRYLQRKNGIQAVCVDYLGKVTGAKGKLYERTAEYSRALSQLSRDIGIALVVAVQCNREPEKRQDKRPTMGDLRDCLSGDAKVMDADTGELYRVEEVAQSGLRFNVWSMDANLRLVKRPISDAWSVGAREMRRVTTRLGRELLCSVEHKLFTYEGWRTVDDLSEGSTVALPRVYRGNNSHQTMTEEQATLLGWMIGDGHFGGTPTITTCNQDEALMAAALGVNAFQLSPRIKKERSGTPARRVVLTTGRLCGAGKNPLTTWLRHLGVWKCTGQNKFVPDEVFRQPINIIQSVLRGLFHADGTLMRAKGRTVCVVKLATISRRLAFNVQHLLTRLGIQSKVVWESGTQSGYQPQGSGIWIVRICNRNDVGAFLQEVGFLGGKNRIAVDKYIAYKANDAGTLDRLPMAVTDHVSEKRQELGLSHSQLGWRAQGKRMSRGTAAVLAEKMGDSILRALSGSDVVWDDIVSIQDIGKDIAYDVSVEGLHNLCVDDFITHNSGNVEQDAGTVILLSRPEGNFKNENGGDTDYDQLMVDVAKNRLGSTTTFTLPYMPKTGTILEALPREETMFDGTDGGTPF